MSAKQNAASHKKMPTSEARWNAAAYADSPVRFHV